MKKTLIALMAMAGVAMGAVVEDHLAIEAEFTTVPVVAGNCWSADYVLTFTLAQDYTLQHGGSVVAFYRGSAVNDTYGYNAITLGGTNEALTLTVGRGRVNNTLNDATGIDANTTFTPTGSAADSVTFATTITKGVAYTLSVTGGDQSMTPTLSWVDAEGIAQSLTASSYKGNMNGNAALTYAVNTEYIPEPATATLSLLALAGLAARRRRK